MTTLRPVVPTRQLYHMDGRPVAVGDEVTSFRDEKYLVAGWPKDGRNKVWVHLPTENAHFPAEFYPSVFDLKWEA